jgi:rhodanese-related sulfurtransferase
MIWLFIFAVLWIVLEIRKQWPVKGLHYITESDLVGLGNGEAVQVVDLREAPDYYAGHIDGAIHIFIGRLSFVWDRHIAPGETIVLVAQDRVTLKKAARLLKKKTGASTIYALVYTEAHIEDGHCVVC